MLSKDEKEIISKIGKYKYRKMKELGLSYEEFSQYEKGKKEEKKLKEKIGYKEYNKMKELGLNYEEYKKYQKEQTLKKYEKKREKDKIRTRTIRYIERYCNLEMKCQICNTTNKIQIHHPNYNDYLKINLLCIKHHNQLHNFELIPPEIIDLENIVIKKPPQKEKQEYIKNNIENIKQDILEKKYTYKQLSEKYKIDSGTIKRHLEKEKDWTILESILNKSGEDKKRFCNLKHQDNLLQKYRIENNLTTKELSNITNIPVATIRAIESGRTDIRKIKQITKKRLEKLKEAK